MLPVTWGVDKQKKNNSSASLNGLAWKRNCRGGSAPRVARSPSASFEADRAVQGGLFEHGSSDSRFLSDVRATPSNFGRRRLSAPEPRPAPRAAFAGCSQDSDWSERCRCGVA